MAREKKFDLKKEEQTEEVQPDYLKELIQERKEKDKLAALVVTYKTALDEKSKECEERKKKYDELWAAFIRLKSMK